MKLLYVWMAVVGVALTAWCQAPPVSGNAASAKKPKVSPLAEYAGDWTAKFNGKIWLRLQLELRGDQLAGSLLHPRNLELNDNGELKSVSDEESSETVVAAVINPDGLLLTLKDAASLEGDRYMMRLVTPEKDTAELKMIAMTMPPGMPKPKPWRLVKSGVAVTKSTPAPR